MFVPCGETSLPARLGVRVLAARNLPVMDKSNVTTDAFVEIHFDSDMYKTDICTKSLSPVWNSEEFVFETDEKCIFDNPVQFRVMDHDTYTANDAIGRVFYDANILVARIRSRRSSENDSSSCTNWLPIYDTLNGIRGEIQVSIRLTLLVSNGECYVKIYSESAAPMAYKVSCIFGLVSEIKVVSDPEYEWIDKIRSPRASNEARQSIIRKSLRDLAWTISQKSFSLGANAILGYWEFVDVEGDATELVSFRVFGTAVLLTQNDSRSLCVDAISNQIISLNLLPDHCIYEYGAVVCARAAHILTDDGDCEAARKRWWKELKTELIRTTLDIHCNLVLAYSEQIAVRKRIALLSCFGTAVSIISSCGSKPSCRFLHSTCVDNNVSPGTKMCCLCKDAVSPDILLSTCCQPSSDLFMVNTCPVQVHISRALSSISEGEEVLASEISHLLPFLEHQLYNRLVSEVQTINSKCCGVFELRPVMVIQEGTLCAILSGTICCLRNLNGKTNMMNSNSFHLIEESKHTARVALLDAARILRSPKSPDKPILQLRSLQTCKNSGNVCEDIEQGNVKHFFKRFGKKIENREHLLRAIADRDIASQLGTFNGLKPTQSLVHPTAGIQINCGAKFAISTKSSKNSTFLQRYTRCFIRETSKTIENMSDLDIFLDGALRDAVAITVSHVESVGASGLSSFQIPSISFSISRDQALIFMLITADFDYSTTL